MGDFVSAALPDVELTDHIRGILAQLDASTLDVDKAVSMPPAVYTSEEWFEFEKRAVWDRQWICVGHHGSVPKAGDYVSITVNDDPLIVQRRDGGKIHVMSAVCQHRGYQLVDDAGNTKVFTCPFHGWTYDINGKLISVPEMEPHASLEEMQKSFCLPQIRTEVWNGFIFINLSGDAPALAPRCKRLTKELEKHHLSDLGATQTVDWGPGPWNWKFMHENAIEPHHTWYLHKGPHDFAPSRLVSFAEWDEDDDGAIYHPTGFVYLDGNFTAAFKCLFPALETLTERERKRVMFACILPNLFLAAVPDGCFYYLVLPNSPHAMTIRVGWVYPQSTLRMKTFDLVFPHVADGLAIFNDQDTVANTAVHKGLKSRFANRGRYAPREATLPQFNRWLIKRYKAYAAQLEAKQGKRRRSAA